MKKTRMVGSLLSLTLTVSVALTGCGGASSEQSGSTNNTAAEAPKEGGTLIIARKADANNLDPHFISNIPSANYVYGKVYESLVSRDKNGEYKPTLATEWKQLDDLTWEFKLREGVTFHDGTPFTADAVKKTFERVLDPKVASPRASNFSMIKEIKIVDDKTVHFVLEYPFAPLLSILASSEGSIISPKAIAEHSDTLAKQPVGTGPFKFTSWAPGQDMKLTKNDTYWGEKPKVDEVLYKVVPEDTTRVAMIEAGEAHIGDQLPVTEVERAQASPGMNMVRAEGLGVDYIGFNVQKKPFDDVRVRQAVAHAIEKQAIVQGVYNNVGTQAVSSMSPKVIGFTPNLQDYSYDVNAAKALLAEAGYPNGFKTSIVTDDRKERMNVAEVIQSQLKGIGIDLEIKVMEYGAYLEHTDNGEHAMFIGGWGNATGDGDYNQYNVFHSTSKGSAGNMAFYNNPEVDKLIEEGRREKDPQKRNEIYAKLQEIELKEVPILPIRTIDHVAVTSKNVNGFWLSPVGYLMLDDVSIN
ncbi:glutathione ABC transporter substrate-binding protein [Brevibacillus sp. MER 51]|uniref:glutathione ABC transporter substrate-binding protein n=1 Tax=Brevibacillus sp. MER 51 TaxID=2939560 RepID=UPI00203C00BC|nr:glutathione ABC transporter substrate-binding protein [Brevibacillus sp. MER 51]MCM3142049.1 glutathione ABC transporter substrate-binding protein [Brevibacillus sp. MER 51]